jgi:hypothetical protein
VNLRFYDYPINNVAGCHVEYNEVPGSHCAIYSELRERMMLAARRGDGLSDQDLEGLLEDLAALEELERTQEDE